MNDLIQTLARELDAAPEHVENVVRLIDEGATIPFIARYRKELHGSMDDQLLRRLADRLQYLRGLDKQPHKGRLYNVGKIDGKTRILDLGIRHKVHYGEFPNVKRL